METNYVENNGKYNNEGIEESIESMDIFEVGIEMHGNEYDVVINIYDDFLSAIEKDEYSIFTLEETEKIAEIVQNVINRSKKE